MLNDKNSNLIVHDAQSVRAAAKRSGIPRTSFRRMIAAEQFAKEANPNLLVNIAASVKAEGKSIKQAAIDFNIPGSYVVNILERFEDVFGAKPEPLPAKDRNIFCLSFKQACTYNEYRSVKINEYFKKYSKGFKYFRKSANLVGYYIGEYIDDNAMISMVDVLNGDNRNMRDDSLKFFCAISEAFNTSVEKRAMWEMKKMMISHLFRSLPRDPGHVRYMAEKVMNSNGECTDKHYARNLSSSASEISRVSCCDVNGLNALADVLNGESMWGCFYAPDESIREKLTREFSSVVLEAALRHNDAIIDTQVKMPPPRIRG